MNRANILPLSNHQAFSKQLSEIAGIMNLVVETHQHLYHEAGLNGIEMQSRFDTLFETLPSDLIFRAYDDREEYAWYGETGVAVTLTQNGQYEANSLPVTNLDKTFPGTVTEISHQGRVLYRKLGGAGEPR